MLFIASFSIAISTYSIFSIHFYGYAENGHDITLISKIKELGTTFVPSSFSQAGTWNLEQVPFSPWNVELVPFVEELAQPWKYSLIISISMKYNYSVFT